MKNLKICTYLTLPTVLLSLNFSSPTQAASSDWVDLFGGEARLSAVKDPSTDKINGMVEIKLKKGWKTYWRNPGDSGIPPKIDFTGSTFFSLDEILFPVPEIDNQNGNQFIGYHNTVRFIFSGQAENIDAALKLSLLAGVCEKICIPAMAEFEIPSNDLNQTDPNTIRSLMLSKSYLPRKPNVQFSLTNTKFNGRNYSATAKIPDGLSDPILLVEGPNDWFSGIVKPKDDLKHFSIELPDMLTSQDGWESQMHYTLIASGQAIEGPLPIDNKSN